MDKRTFHHIIRTSLLGTAMLLTIGACEDDHYTVNDGGGAGENATLTLWEQIKANPDLSRFKELAEKTPYFKDEGHVVNDYTFANVLDGTQILTVFAPTNTALSDEEYNRYKSMLQGSLSDQYDVFLRLIGNHITRNRYAVTGTGEEKLVMVNGKRATFDHQAGTFKGIKLTTTNIAATNGTLHKMDELSPFAYNVYEYIKAHPEKYGKLREWLMRFDTLYFDQDLSAEGGSDANGNPIFVDSVYSRENCLFGYYYTKRGEEWVMNIKGIGGNIEREDSIWAMALLTDQGWEEADGRMADFYEYAELYIDKEKENEGNKDQCFGGNQDSLRELSLSMDIVSPLLYNARIQLETPQHKGFWTAEQFRDTPMNKVFNARSDTFYIASNSMADVKPFLLGTEEPVEVSNGLVYNLEHWQYGNTYRGLDVEMKLNSAYIFGASTNTNNNATWIDFNNNSAFANLYGSISTDEYTNKTGFMAIYNTGTSKSSMSFQLRDLERNKQVMSNVVYDIYVVMVPTFYGDQTQWDSLTVTPMKNKCALQILYNDGTVKTANNRQIAQEKKSEKWEWDYDGSTVQTICISNKTDGIKFPISYKNITRSYPVLTIESAAKAADLKNGYQHTFYVDRIIFKARR